MTLGQKAILAAILAAMLAGLAGCGGGHVPNAQEMSDMMNADKARDDQRFAESLNRQFERDRADRAEAANRSYAPIDESDETAPEQPRPANGVVSVSTRAPRVAELRIITPAGATNYYFKLVDSATGATAATIFAAGGQTVSARVPLGSYRLRYASGRTWRGPQVLFGEHHTHFGAFGNLLAFRREGDQIVGAEIDMNIQANGNLTEDSVAPGGF